MKKILVVDDSALMRRVLCDIINSDKRFHVEDFATNGLEAFDLLSRKTYDAVVLDVNMPKMGGIELLRELQKFKLSAKVMMASTATSEGAKVTMEALELGAVDFVHKPVSAGDCRGVDFKERLLKTLSVVADSTVDMPVQRAVKPFGREPAAVPGTKPEVPARVSTGVTGKKLIAIASSTGGPKALQSVIPRLPKDLQAPVLLVQHMPKGFTASLAERLNSLSEITVREAAEGDVLENGCVYLSMGGSHLTVAVNAEGRYVIHYTDEPPREGVRPCANYMYESLGNSRFDEVVCVVMTGMGADGTQGISNLKKNKKIHVIAQEQSTCVVYGMPKSIVTAGLADQIVPLEQIAQAITAKVGGK